MKRNVEQFILKTIDKNESILSLFSLGYYYAQIFKWLNELESNGYIEKKDGIEMITDNGKKRLMDLELTSKINILPLEEFKTDRKDIDEIYLPW